MLKKGLYTGASIAIVGLLMFGSNIYYMGQDLIGGARDLGDQLVSVENKIEHARRDIKALDSDILSLTQDIAKEELSCEKLQEEVLDKTRSLSEQHAHMEILNRHLKESPTQTFVATNNRSYTTNQVKMDLASSLNQYKTQQQMLAALENQLDSRVSIVATAKERLEETRRVQSELMSELESLKAEHNMNEVVKITSELKLDNSRLNRAKKALEKLETQIRVDSNVLNQVKTSGRIPTEEPELQDLDTISAQYETFFGKSSLSVVKN
jgi:chromosome segregation ATPase